MDSLWRDLRVGLRLLARNRGFTLAALVAPALGIGANAAIFSVVNSVLVRPLPYPESDKIVGIWATAPERGLDHTELSYPRFVGIADENRSFERVGAFARDSVTFAGREEPRPWQALRCNAALLDVLRVRPALGRNFRPEEEERGGPAVALVGHEAWRGALGSDPDIVGKPIILDGIPHTVVGVLPAGFGFSGTHVDVLIPRVFEPSFLTEGAVERGSTYLELVARLRPGVTQGQAQADLDRIAGSDRRLAFLDAGLGYSVSPLAEQITKNVRPTLLILLAAVSLTLLIACANVANLLLARAVGRRRETALRAALGASRSRLILQFLAESLLLSLIAGVVGLSLASAALGFLVAAVGDALPRAAEIRLDGTVLLVGLAATLATGVLFGLAPALHASKVDLAQVLREGRGSSSSRQGARTRGFLVVGEIAVAVMLLIGAGLLMRSVGRLRDVDAGFAGGHLLVARIHLPPSRYSEPTNIRAFYQRLARETATLPGVLAVGAAESVPLEREAPQTLLAIEGQPLPDLSARPVVSLSTVSPGFFKAMGIPLLDGRAFTDQDDPTVPIRVIVSQKLAKRFFGDESPLGHRVLLGKSSNAYEIVGMVGDVRLDGLAAPPTASFYLSANQRTVASMAMVVRTEGEPLALAGALRRQVLAIDPSQPVTSVRTMEDIAAESLGDRRLALLLLAVFAAIGFALAATGIYGVMAYSVSQRTSEIGVRMALGAGGRDVLLMVLGQGLRVALLGVGIGMVAAVATARILSGLLFGVTTSDPLTYGAVGLLLGVVALIASLVPAARAARTAPQVALRAD